MNQKDPLLRRRIVMALAGMIITGISIGFFKRAFFGVDPFQCFCNGLALVIPIDFGTLYMLINAVLLAVVLVLDKHYIGISTFVNLFLLGYIIEFSEHTLARLFGDVSLPVRIVFFLVGVWHGADWTFIVYGLMNGAIMAFSQLMTDPYKKWKKALHIKGTEPAWHMFQIVRTYILVQLCWFFDRAANMDVSLTMIKNMFTHFDASQILEIAAGSGGTAFVPQALAIIAVGTIIMIAIGLLRERGIDIREKIAALPLPVGVAIYLLLFCLIGFVGCTAAPKGFIYAQF